MVISIDVEKLLIRYSTHLWEEHSAKVRVVATFLNIIRAIYKKLTVNITLNKQKLKAFPLRSRTR